MYDCRSSAGVLADHLVAVHQALSAGGVGPTDAAGAFWQCLPSLLPGGWVGVLEDAPLDSELSRNTLA